jgi:hypothetical protein
MSGHNRHGEDANFVVARYFGRAKILTDIQEQIHERAYERFRQAKRAGEALRKYCDILDRVLALDMTRMKGATFSAFRSWWQGIPAMHRFASQFADDLTKDRNPFMEEGAHARLRDQSASLVEYGRRLDEELARREGPVEFEFAGDVPPDEFVAPSFHDAAGRTSLDDDTYIAVEH